MQPFKKHLCCYQDKVKVLTMDNNLRKKRKVIKRSILVFSFFICGVSSNTYSLEVSEHIEVTKYLQSNATVVDKKQEKNFTSPLTNHLTNNNSTISFNSKYVNTKFDRYTDASAALVFIKNIYIEQGYKTVSECNGLTCGNALQLAQKIQSENFLSNKDQQQYLLLYNNYEWVSLHVSSYENNNFLFIRKVSEETLKAPLEHLTFKKGNYELSNGTKNTLNKLIPTIKSSELYFYVIGHTDNTGDSEFNYILAKKRALKVYDYLINQGVNKDKLLVESAGENAPLNTNKTQQGKARNRRVELIESSTL